MDYRQFISGFRRAYEHKGGIKSLDLGTFGDKWFAELKDECSDIITGADGSEVGDENHVTYWTRPQGRVQQFSLFNSSGNSGDYSSDFGGRNSASRKRLTFPDKPRIADLANLFGMNLRNMRLNCMYPSAGLKPHEEGAILARPFGIDYVARFHVPIVTNNDAWMYLDAERFHYDTGHLYFFHHGCVHAGQNLGSDPRYHIVIDAFLNKALFKRLFPSEERVPFLDKNNRENAEMKGEPFPFEDFARENGDVLKDLDYGRRAPNFLTYHEGRHPRAFRLLGLSSVQ